MNAIKGLSELLMLSRLDSSQKNYVSNIVSSSNSLLKIINNILDFSKIDAGRVDIVNAPYRLADAITEQAGLANVSAKEKGLLFLIDIDPMLPSSLKGDDLHLKQVLGNVLSNAVKYTREGRVLLSVEGVRSGGSVRLVFTVADTGLGIREEEIGALFEAFMRADLRKNRSILGTGLGLAITKKLLQSMGGDIEVESEYGKGSTFRFWVTQEIVDNSPTAVVNDPSLNVLLFEEGARGNYVARILERLGVRFSLCASSNALPRMLADGYTHCIYFEDASRNIIERNRNKVPPKTTLIAIRDIRFAMEDDDGTQCIAYEPLAVTNLAEALNRSAGASGAVFFTTESKQVDRVQTEDVSALLVDDNDINLLVGEEVLASFGIKVKSVSSGYDALAECGSQKFDIIFMDHMMPIMDGVETTRRIKAQKGPNVDTPIVALTANVVNDMREAMLKQGLDDFIGKPIEVDDLNRVLATWLPSEKMSRVASVRHASMPLDDLPRTPGEFELVKTLDDFGMYASDVMKELRGRKDIYISRLESTMNMLPDTTGRAGRLLKAENLDEFANEMTSLARLLRDAGARDCAGRARKIAAAASEGNVEYVNSDFRSLMGNMFMLEKKLTKIVPLAKGEDPKAVPMNDEYYIWEYLKKMNAAMRRNDASGTAENLREVASVSLDRDLDGSLNRIRWLIEDGNLAEAEKICDELCDEYAKRVAAHDAGAVPRVRGAQSNKCA